jgi:hypothetical protein
MRNLKINEKFKDACPELSQDELQRLENLIVKDGIIYNPILIWNNMIIDGHNRYSIAKKLGIEFTTNEISFESDEDAIIWIKENAISQRNLTDYAKYELVHDIEVLLLEIGKKRKSEVNIGNKNASVTNDISVSDDDQPSESLPEKPKHSTREILMEKSGLSSGQIVKAQSIYNKAKDEVKERLRKGETTIGAVYKELKKDTTKVNTDIELLDSAAKSLNKWMGSYGFYKCLIEFTPDVSIIIEKIKNKANLINNN